MIRVAPRDRPHPPGRDTVRRPDRFRARYGPWAVVTGASDGIGRATALRLAASGLHVVLVARRAALLHDLAGRIALEHGVETRAVPADLGTADGVDAVHAATADLDVGLLVAAAGFGTGGPFLDTALADEQTMLAVNCAAVLTTTLHHARRLAARGRGGIVLFGSLVGRQGSPFAAHYAATKAYVQALGEGLHQELAPHHVDVLVSVPGPVHSGFADRAGMRMGAADSADRVATGTLDALGRRTVVVPGTLSKTLTWSLAPLPRRARSTVMGRVMYGMTRERPPEVLQ